MSDALDPGKWPALVQIVMGLAAGVASAVLWVFGSRRNGRRSTDDNHQKLRDENLGHRLRADLQTVLEAHRISVTAALEEHKRQIREDIAGLDERLRDVELALARLSPRND